jgi:hypothetical protein
METGDSPVTAQESLRIIEQSIRSAQARIYENGFFYLLWGWLIFAASLSHYLLQFVLHVRAFWISWLILIPVGVIFSIVQGFKRGRSVKVKTFADEVIQYLAVAFLVSLFITLFFMGRMKLNCYPVIMLLYGIMLFVSGGVLRFRPLLFGGIINWMLALPAFFVTFDIQLLLLSAAVLLGYIIPGHLLNHQFNKSV